MPPIPTSVTGKQENSSQGYVPTPEDIDANLQIERWKESERNKARERIASRLRFASKFDHLPADIPKN